ncbi:MAG: helix-turn-helix domain-containing protein [Bacteroidales bacterium]|nr:helix-turn-helix domain-containing protein [Bacteroidales bacterium]
MTVYFPSEQKYIDKLTQIVEENFTNNSFGVTELAKKMSISHSGLHRKLKAIAKQSVSQFIRETRLKRAKELLQQQAGTVAEVAYGVGFGSTTYFSKCFHDYYGYPPGEARKKYVSEPDRDEKTDHFEIPENHIKSIAVLPFDNYTGDDNQAFLIFGMHDALISELGQLGAIRVVSKTSVLAYTNSEKTIKEIATELGVDAIIEASVMIVEGKIRIQLKLFNAFPEEKQLWAQTFDVDMDNILKLYGQVIRKVASEIQYTLSPEQQTQLDEIREVNPNSYKAYLRGKYNLYQQTPEGIKKGLEYLHEAVRIDPAEPLAYAGLALGYLDIAHGPFNAGDAYVKAESAGRQAIKLDPNLAEAQLALAEICMYVNWDFHEAEKYFKRAVELNPNLSIAHYQYAWTLFLFGRNEEALVEHELAWKCDPFNPGIAAFFGALLSYLGRYDDAILQAHKSFDILKDYPVGHFVLGETYLAMGRKDEAIEAHQKLAEFAPPWGWVLGYTYALTGYRDEAVKILNQLEKTELSGWNALGLAVLYGALGMLDEAFKWIGYEPHHVWIPWIAVMPLWKPLYTDPRHAAFVNKLNLPKI